MTANILLDSMRTAKGRDYVKPPVELLADSFNPTVTQTNETLAQIKDIVENKLAFYEINAEFVGARKGPTTTLCVMKMKDRSSLEKLISLRERIAKLFGSRCPLYIVRDAGNPLFIGLQIPNAEREVVGLKECMLACGKGEKGTFVLGKDEVGEAFACKLFEKGNVLIAGECGSGKSVFLRGLLTQILMGYSPGEVKLLLADPKGEWGAYENLPHLLTRKPLGKEDELRNALRWLEREVRARLDVFANANVGSIDEYNAQTGVRIPRILVLFDEGTPTCEQIAETAEMLAQNGKKTGVYMIYATQGIFQTNEEERLVSAMGTKILFAMADGEQSFAVLQGKGAECLLGNGDMLIKCGERTKRIQGAFLSREDGDRIAAITKSANPCAFDEEVIRLIVEEREPKPEPMPTVEREKEQKPEPCEKENEEFDFDGAANRLAQELEKAGKTVKSWSVEQTHTGVAFLFDLGEENVVEEIEEEAETAEPEEKDERTEEQPTAELVQPKREEEKKRKEPLSVPEEPEEEEDEDDAPDGEKLKWNALRYCVEANYVSPSYLQRKLKRGYSTIADILSELEQEGYVSACGENSSRRELTITKERFEREWAKRFGSER